MNIKTDSYGKRIRPEVTALRIRKEDLDLISTLCDKYEIDFEWMSEDILRKLHAVKVDKIEMRLIRHFEWYYSGVVQIVGWALSACDRY